MKMQRKVAKVSLLVVALTISIIIPILVVTAKKEEWVLDPIIIDEFSILGPTWADLADKPWLKGSGTPEDPYIIKNVVINGVGFPYCMMIRNSRVFFKIQDCTFSNTKVVSGFQTAGLVLFNTQNGFVFKNHFFANGLGEGAGIALMFSHYNTIQKNLCNENTAIGIYLTNSNYNRIHKNLCNDNAVVGIYITNSNDNLITQNLCERNNWAGIYIGDGSSYNKVTKNDCIENLEGIFIVNGANNNEIKRNDVFNNNGNGIYLSANANHNLITRNYCYNNEGIGIVVETSNGNIITKNDCKENLGYGIALKNSNEHFITDNDCSENGGAGINLEHSNDNLITNNDCNENQAQGITMDTSNGNTIIDNYCSNNVGPGISFRFSNDNIITQNLCTGSPWGIIVSRSNNNEVTKNDCIENGEGIVVYDAYDNKITENYCTGNYENGIILAYNANYNIINQNNCSENLLSGILLMSSSGTIISKNDCNNNGESGISITDPLEINAKDNILYGNKIAGNLNGIYFSEADNNDVFRNTIKENTNGMVIEGQSELNLIYQNNFIDNGAQASNLHAGLNNWHNIYMLEGNYWSDYTGTDSNGDGIGDTPWPWPEYDVYPFMEKDGWEYTTPLEDELLDAWFYPDFNRLGAYRTVYDNKTTYIMLGMGHLFSKRICDSYMPPYTIQIWFYTVEYFFQGDIWFFIEEDPKYEEPAWYNLFYIIIPPYTLLNAGLPPGWNMFQWNFTWYTNGELQYGYYTSYFYLV